MTQSLPHGVYELIQDYIDYYGWIVQVHEGPPSPVESHRLLRSNRPCVFRNAAKDVPALKKWTSNEYLVDKVGHRTKVTTAVTTNGLADSVSTVGDKDYFVEPLYQKIPFGSVLEHLDSKYPDSSFQGGGWQNAILYLQAQNNNLPTEFPMLQSDVEMPVWARAMFDEEPAATNLWIGDQRSITSLHCDPFENLYLTVTGTKLFVLFPPHELACMHEKKYPCAKLDDDLKPIPSADAKPVPWITIPTKPMLPKAHDPTFSTCNINEIFTRETLEEQPNLQYAHPHRVVLRAGDMLYLPSMWLHGVGQVGQSASNPKCIAVNWWHDMDYAPGGVWSLNQLVRNMTL